mgnify:FL=1|jgi:hypothetical protein
MHARIDVCTQLATWHQYRTYDLYVGSMEDIHDEKMDEMGRLSGS